MPKYGYPVRFNAAVEEKFTFIRQNIFNGGTLWTFYRAEAQTAPPPKCDLGTYKCFLDLPEGMRVASVHKIEQPAVTSTQLLRKAS